MPTPTVPTRVTVNISELDAGGNPLDGRVIFTPTVKVKTSDGTAINASPVVVKVSGGVSSVALIATDATGCTPVGWTYRVDKILGLPGSAGALGQDAWVRDTFYISLPSASSPVNLNDLTQVDPPPPNQFQVRTVAGVGADVAGNVNLTATDLQMAGIGFATEADLTAQGTALTTAYQAADAALDTRTDALELAPPNHASRHAPGGADDISGSYVASSRINAASGVAGLNGSSKLTASQLPTGVGGVPILDGASKVPLASLPTGASGLATLDAGGLLPSSAVPAIAISDFLGTVASQAAMLALTGQRGDWCVRSDLGATFILNADTPTVLASWTQVATPADAVTSVAGKTGVVALVKADVGLSSVDNTADTAKPVSTAQQAAINDIVDPSMAINDTVQYGDLFETVPRAFIGAFPTLATGLLAFAGGKASRAVTGSTKLRFYVSTVAPAGAVLTMVVYKGSSRTALAKQNTDVVVTSSFASTGLKEVTITGVTWAKGDFVYFGILRTGTGTPDPALGAATFPVIMTNVAAAELLAGTKTGQSALPATLDVSASFTTWTTPPFLSLAQ